ncbi:hypothetical protein KY289_016538 [Solanum tuberosum]|nr:hypothetical protein KY289_016538 [Solanum tuberosum]
MSRTRAYISGGYGEAVPEVVVHAPARTPARGRSRKATPARGRGREASLEPYVDVNKDQVPSEFGAPLFQETLLRIFGVLRNLSLGAQTPTTNSRRSCLGRPTTRDSYTGCGCKVSS